MKKIIIGMIAAVLLFAAIVNVGTPDKVNASRGVIRKNTDVITSQMSQPQDLKLIEQSTSSIQTLDERMKEKKRKKALARKRSEDWWELIHKAAPGDNWREIEAT